MLGGRSHDFPQDVFMYKIRVFKLEKLLVTSSRIICTLSCVCIKCDRNDIQIPHLQHSFQNVFHFNTFAINVPKLVSFASISEVNKGRSKVNKPSRPLSLTRLPNGKGQRVLRVITGLPECVLGFMFFVFSEFSFFHVYKNHQYIPGRTHNKKQSDCLCVCDSSLGHRL